MPPPPAGGLPVGFLGASAFTPAIALSNFSKSPSSSYLLHLQHQEPFGLQLVNYLYILYLLKLCLDN